MHCPACHIPLTPGLVRVRYRGEERHWSITLRGIPAQTCPQCRCARLSPHVQRRLDSLGGALAETAGPLTWHVASERCG